MADFYVNFTKNLHDEGYLQHCIVVVLKLNSFDAKIDLIKSSICMISRLCFQPSLFRCHGKLSF